MLIVLTAISCTEQSSVGEPTDSIFDDTDQTTGLDGISETDETKPLCPVAQSALTGPSAPLPPAASEHRGIDIYETAAFQLFLDTALQDPGIHFITTFDHKSSLYEIYSGEAVDRISVKFRRVSDDSHRTYLEVTDGDLEAIFPSQNPDQLNRYDEFLAQLENPHSAVINGQNYDHEDPRVGFIPDDQQSFPHVLERIAALFDAPDAPDLAVGFRPWAHRGPGTHGGMSVLQSRSTLVMKGPGVKKGVFLEEAAKLVDVAPTVLALLDAPTIGGVGPDAVYDDGLYLARQDGRVLHEVFDTEECAQPRYALIILFDGLLPTELLHQAESPTPDIELPTFQEIIFGGTTFRSGAVSNFPSVSAPGHMTAGSGLWSGHHGFVANSIYRRSTRESITAFALLDDVAGTLGNPQILIDIYKKSVAPGIETLAQAAHRAFGDYNPETKEGAFTAVLNDLPLGGADYTTVDFILAGGSGSTSGASVTTYAMADSMAVNQVETVLDTPGLPVPKILQVSLFATDAAGEASGPHSNLLRSVLEDQDKNLERILNAYAARGVLHETLIVLVSDHGMELQDPTRNQILSTHIKQSGLKATHGGSGLYFLPTLEVESSTDPASGKLKITVADHWTGLGVENALVTCTPCEPMELQTDASGHALFQPSPTSTDINIIASHDEFNAQNVALTWP